MRDFIAIFCLSFCLIFGFAEYRGIDLIHIPGISVADPAPGVVVPGDGIRVLFISPGDPNDKLPVNHDAIPMMGVFRDWVKKNKADYRNWPEGEEGKFAPPAFGVMAKIPRTASRWMVVANGTKVRFSGPWPATADEALKVLENCK